MSGKNASGYYVYKKGLRQRKTPYRWIIITGIAFFILYFIYFNFRTVEEVSPPKGDVRLPARVSRVVNENRMFASGWFTNDIENISIKDAKIYGIKHLLPVLGTTTYKELFSINLIQSNVIMSIDLMNIGSVRSFRYTLYHFPNNTSFYHTEAERYSRRISFEKAMAHGSMKTAAGSFSFDRETTNFMCALKLDRKAVADLSGAYTSAPLGVMVNWNRNKGMLEQVATGTVNGRINIPGDSFVLSNAFFATTYITGIMPVKCSSERIIGTAFHPSAGMVILSVFTARPGGAIPAKAFYNYRGQWTPITGVEITHNDDTKVTSVTSTNEGAVIAFTPHYTVNKKTGALYPVIESLTQHGSIAATLRIYGQDITFNGRAVREWCRAQW
ncbi:MAG: hypothetical protein HZC28_03135 [Spirochaetes bacterium]|nr:hypothetical protein [Spirochaetota bacterium]